MRTPVRITFLAAVALVALAVGACGASSPSAPGVPAAPSTSGLVASQPELTPVVPTPVAGSDAPGAVVITALNLEFQPKAVSVPAGRPFVLMLANRDQAVPHGLSIGDPTGTVIAKGEVVVGPATSPLQVGALAAGSYTFNCQVHPNMTGTLTVTP